MSYLYEQERPQTGQKTRWSEVGLEHQQWGVFDPYGRLYFENARGDQAPLTPIRKSLRYYRNLWEEGWKETLREVGSANEERKKSRENTYGAQAWALDGFLLLDHFHFSGKVYHSSHSRLREFSEFGETSAWMDWSEFARGMIQGKYPFVGWEHEDPYIDRQAMSFIQKTYRPHEEDIPINLTSTANRLEFRDPNLVFYMASRSYIQTDNNDAILNALTRDNLLQPEVLTRSSHLLSFIAEHILLHRTKDFRSFIEALIDTIGGEDGYDLARGLVEDVSWCLPKKLTFQWNQDVINTLIGTQWRLPEKYSEYKYKNRNAVIPPEILERAMHASNFWEELFQVMGIEEIMKKQADSPHLQSVLKTALKERKVISGLVLIFSHIMGYNEEQAKRFAAACQICWGFIVSYDNIVDGQMVRKEEPTDLVNGISVALPHTMLALLNVVKNTLLIDESDPFYDNKFSTWLNSMLIRSCEADIHSKELGWADRPYEFLDNMERLVFAFSWFTGAIGERTGFVESGKAFGQFLSFFHTIGQMNNDIEDNQRNLTKHKRGEDIGTRISLFWRTLNDLKEVKDVEKRKMMAAWEKGAQLDDAERFAVADIGLAHQEAVVASVYADIERKYLDARRALEEGFRVGGKGYIPIMDDVNARYKQVLLKGLEDEWQKFLNYGGLQVTIPLQSQGVIMDRQEANVE
jgi:hypothetical protein